MSRPCVAHHNANCFHCLEAERDRLQAELRNATWSETAKEVAKQRAVADHLKDLLVRANTQLKLINGPEAKCILDPLNCPNHKLIRDIEEALI